MKPILSENRYLTTTPVGVYWCEETNEVVIQTCENGAPMVYTMPLDWRPDEDKKPSSVQITNQSTPFDLATILAVTLHSAAAERCGYSLYCH